MLGFEDKAEILVRCADMLRKWQAWNISDMTFEVCYNQEIESRDHEIMRCLQQNMRCIRFKAAYQSYCFIELMLPFVCK